MINKGKHFGTIIKPDEYWVRLHRFPNPSSSSTRLRTTPDIKEPPFRDYGIVAYDRVMFHRVLERWRMHRYG